jgi:branched-chain amino acid transport system ATP-binding protein
LVLLEVDRITKRFGGLQVLCDVSLGVERGELLGIIGPNGAGKTTLLNIISGLLPPDGGRILLDGLDITRSPPHVRSRLGIARTFQIPQPFTSLTVLENVALSVLQGVRGLSRASAEEKAKGLLELVGLGDKAGLYPTSLSVVDLRRLELCRALARGSRLLLLDEVSPGLTAQELLELMKLIRQINAEGVTVVIVEHVMRVIVELCHRVVALHEGRIIAEGRPQEVVAHGLVRRAYLGD